MWPECCARMPWSTSEHATYFQTWPSLLRFSLGTQPSSGVQRAELWNTLSNNLSLWNVKPTCEIYYKNRLKPREHGHNPILGRFAGSHSPHIRSLDFRRHINLYVCMSQRNLSLIICVMLSNVKLQYLTWPTKGTIRKIGPRSPPRALLRNVTYMYVLDNSQTMDASSHHAHRTEPTPRTRGVRQQLCGQSSQLPRPFVIITRATLC